MVLGVGNLLLSDEGVGVHLVRRLAALDLPEDVEVLDGGTAPLQALHDVRDLDRLIVVDATRLSAPPGTIVRLTAADVAPSQGRVSLHDFAMHDALLTWQTWGLDPEAVVLLGVCPGRVEMGDALSPEVEAALPRLVSAVCDELFTSADPGSSGDDCQPAQTD